MGSNKLSSFLPPVLKRELEYGVPRLNFATAGVKGYSFAQAKATPIDINVANNIETVESTTGSHVPHQNQRQKGLRDVSSNISHSIGSNDVIFMIAMYFQNAYKYTPTITDNTIVSIALNGTTATVEFNDLGTNITTDDGVVIFNSANAEEDGIYAISNITTDTIDILNVSPTFSTTDIARGITTIFNLHEAMIEYHDPTGVDCSMKELDSSFTGHFGQQWDKAEGECEIGKGELVTGIIGTKFSVDFMNATYSNDIVSRDIEYDSVNVPSNKTQYNYPIGFNGLMDKMNTFIEIEGVTQTNTIELSLDITPNVNVDVKSREARKLIENNTDGVTIEVNWKMLFKTDIEAANQSKLILSRQDDLSNGLVLEMGIKDELGASFTVKGKVMFGDIVKNKEQGGTTLTVPGTINVADEQENFVAALKNGYNSSLSDFFRTTL